MWVSWAGNEDLWIGEVRRLPEDIGSDPCFLWDGDGYFGYR